jgi:hypothetical protein
VDIYGIDADAPLGFGKKKQLILMSVVEAGIIKLTLKIIEVGVLGHFPEGVSQRYVNAGPKMKKGTNYLNATG